MKETKSSPTGKACPDFLSRAYWNGTIKMSLSKYFILGVLHRRAMHGYEIAREVASFTRGCCSPAEGTIYPVLRQFEDGGYVTSRTEVVSGRERRIYTLTRRGRQAFKVAVEAWMEVTQALGDCEQLIAAGAHGEAAAR
ncbi:MAG: PadR family transcriptional regulator [Gammaproteobacteria bacterium]|nr:PadR family transcriptional regulator [Gammaproteobacteria bacterium]